MATDGDVEWEDAAADDWEVLIEGDDEADAVAGSSGRDVVVELDIDNGQGKKRVQRVVVTKQQRLMCQAVHRLHVLCLLARLTLHDEAASAAELQALMLSLLPPQHLPTADPLNSGPNTKRQLAQLKQLVAWFGATFSPMAYTDDESQTLASLTETALRLKTAPAEVLVVLFVALLRGLGLLVRYVMVLDAVPLEPWRKAAPKSLRLVSVQEAKAKEEAHGRKKTQKQSVEEGDEGEGASGRAKGKALRKAPGGVELDDEVEEAVRTLVAASNDPRTYKVKALLSDLADQLPDIKLSKSQQTAVRKLMEDVVSTLTEDQPASGRKRGRGQGAKGEADTKSAAVHNGQGRGQKRAKSAGGAAGAAGGDDDEMPQGAEPSQPGPNSGGAGKLATKSGKGRPNLGEQEFDRELQLALMATAAEAQARELHRMAAGAGPPTSAPAATTGSAKTLRSLRAEIFGTKSKGAAKGSSLAGQVSGSRGGLVPTVWAEVYCGCAETGRWVHVDVINGLVDRPETVEAATQRSSPIAYVVACSPDASASTSAHPSSSSAQPSAPASQARSGSGAAALNLRPSLANQEVKDVTNRYVSSLLALQKVRDSAWWEATATRVYGERVSAAAAGPPAQLPSEPAADSGKAGPSSACDSKAATAAAGTGMGSGSGSGPSGARQVHGSRGPSSVVPAASALRAKREDAELHQRAMSQMQGLPTSVEGFKAHPTYILKRHIGKYEALRPGSAILGTHRGEPFYARSAVSILHTAERWRRDGREVSADQLGKPCKVAPKRKQPPPPGASRGGYSRWGAGGGAGSGSGRKGSKGRKGAAVEDEEDDDLGEGPTGEEGSAASGPMVDLYGDWQTELWTRPEASDGVVPKNAHGNVECPPLVKALPLGTVHLPYSGIWSVCKLLNIDYAPALVGFEVQAGRMLPKIDGVVVCEEFETQVVSAYMEREMAKQEALAAKRRREAVASWFQLLQAMRTRLELQSRHEQPTAALTTLASPSSGRQRKRRESGDDVIDLTELGEQPQQPSQREQLLQQLQDKYGSTAGRAQQQQQQRAVVQSSGMEVEEI